DVVLAGDTVGVAGCNPIGIATAGDVFVVTRNTSGDVAHVVNANADMGAFSLTLADAAAGFTVDLNSGAGSITKASGAGQAITGSSDGDSFSFTSLAGNVTLGCLTLGAGN